MSLCVCLCVLAVKYFPSPRCHLNLSLLSHSHTAAYTCRLSNLCPASSADKAPSMTYCMAHLVSFDMPCIYVYDHVNSLIREAPAPMTTTNKLVRLLICIIKIKIPFRIYFFFVFQLFSQFVFGQILNILITD